MALITTIAEIKAVLPRLVANTNATSLLPNFDAVEEKYLVPLIGNDLYTDLVGKYDGNTLDAAELLLVKHIRLMIAAQGFLDEQAATHVFFTDAGIRVAASGNLQKAVGWEYKELQRFLGTRVLDGMEVMLNYLWKNKADFPLWTDSAAYKRFESGLIRSATDFTEHYTLFQPMRTFYALKSLVDDVQDEYVATALGNDLVKYFATVEEPVEAEKSIIRKIKKAICFFTVLRATEHLPVRFGDNGFTVIADGGDRESDDSGRAAASMQLLQLKMKACEREGKNFAARAKYEIAQLRKEVGAPAGFVTAYDAGPLKTYLDPKDQTSGNEKHRFFRF